MVSYLTRSSNLLVISLGPFFFFVFFNLFGLDRTKLIRAAPNALIMHPGPMNRGVEIDSATADDVEKSLIRTQVEMGVAARMACLEALVTRQT